MKTLSTAVDAIIFDIDNVLVDTRRSYLDSIRYTIQIFLTFGAVPFFLPPADPKFCLLEEEDVENFKLLGGFNDDWDCCYGLLVYLLNLEVRTRTLEELKDQVNMTGFMKQVKKRPLGVSGIVDMIGRPHAIRIERIGRVFQEIYLGKDLFQSFEKRRAVFWKKRGLIHKEKLIIKKSALVKLKEMGIKLGIATGRSRFEALYALKQFGILELFDALTTMDEIKAEEKKLQRSLRKPHPFSLIETANRIGKQYRFFYVGDLPDDILAGNQAKKFVKMKSVAFPYCAVDTKKSTEELKKASPDHLIRRPAELLALVAKVPTASAKP